MAKKILIYGVGPFGSLFAERLSEAGHGIAVLDHGERQQDLKRFGIVIEFTFGNLVLRIPSVCSLRLKLKKLIP